MLLGNNAEELKQLLSVVEEWCKKWCVLINVGKSKVVHFRKRGHATGSNIFHIGGELLEQVKTYKYLGFSFDEFLTLDEGITQLANAGSRALGSVIGKTRDNFDLGYQSYSKLFTTCVTPVVDYASSAWSLGKDYQKLDSIQLRGM